MIREESFSATLSKTVGCHYLLYLPEGYGDDAGKRWPTILFLHGAGERGDDLSLVQLHGPLRRVREGEKLPFVILAPQCPENETWRTDVLQALLGKAWADLRLDEDRVYVTGLSMGGLGTWELAAEAPDRLAAIAPICGLSTWFDPGTLDRLPVWCFHGALDRDVPVEESIKMVRRIREYGGSVRFTVYPNAEHDSWTQTYEDPKLYEWFLSERRQR